ncbi:ABC transporter permease [uncultured Ruminococcus sp.]|uniref:ABC transporter permease n=1 Tax=uncultured Ruminococcus sp. TaxID=165186 RepID=UPI00261560E2|nr:ABC transporter permease [uncultured Ruminococcus sp.]
MVKLIKSGFRKDRAVLIVFLLIITVSTMLLHTGMLVSTYPRLYDEYVKEDGLADYLMFTAADEDTIERALDSIGDITEYHSEETVIIHNLTVYSEKTGKEKENKSLYIQRMGDNAGYDRLRFLERDDSVSGRKLYLNLRTAYSNNLCVGDNVRLDTPVGSYEYTVAGIYQHLLMGNYYYYLLAMVDDDSFRELQEAKRETYPGEDRIVYVKCSDGTDPEASLKNALDKLRGDNGEGADGYTRILGRNGYTVIVNILAGFMAAFALIMITICICMIVFTVNNNISRDIRNIGALRAVGHTVGQIRSALISEYVILGLTGTVIGIILSYVLFPVIEYLYIREISGIVWKNRFCPVITASVLAGILAVVIAAVIVSTVKIKKLHPATALRFGLKSNSFKKNHLPLSETKGELNILLALKSSLQNMGQNMIIFLVITAVAFVTQFSATLYYNAKVDITNFQRMIQGDTPDAYVDLNDSSYETAVRVRDEIEKVDGVSQVYGLWSATAYIEGSDVMLIYVTDPDNVYCGVYEGDIMREDNEAVLGSTVAEKLGVGVGDEVVVDYNGKSARYLITGLQQSVMNSRIYVTDGAARKLGVDTVYGDLRVRVDDADAGKVDEVLERIDALGDSAVAGTRNDFRRQRSKDNMPVFAVSFIVMIMILLSIATVVLVIRLLLKTVFIKKEKEFGIKKAVGFTSTQLRYQLSLSLMPTTVLAAAAGSVLGYFMMNPLFTLILSGYGVMNADLITKPLLIIVSAAAVTLLVFVFSFVMSGKMKKISAYRLIQE